MVDDSRDVDLIIPTVPEMELTATKTAVAVGEFMGLDEEKIEETKMGLIEALYQCHRIQPERRRTD